MPHRSRLSILLLDLPPEHHVAGTDFWAGATGRPAEPDSTDPDWASLGSFADGWHVEIQRTGEGTPPRWHVDIETDDIPAEVRRLERLGAAVVERLERWVVMEAPSGQRFCVIRAQSRDFAAKANHWEDEA